MVILFLVAASLASPLHDLRERTRADGRWRSPTVHEREAAAAAVELLARDPECSESTLSSARSLLARAHLSLDREGRVLLVHDAEDPRGSGVLALRCGAASPLVWQAPHSYFDDDTGDLVEALFAEGDARATLWNSAHRYRATDTEDRDGDVHPADVAHEPGNLFQAWTVALAAADTDLRFVQVHGFSASVKGEGRDRDAILSSGDAAAPPETLGLALSPVLGRVAVFGRDVEVLGGTTNVQGQALRRWPEPRFTHVELSPAARQRLADDPATRAAFARVFLEVEW